MGGVHGLGFGRESVLTAFVVGLMMTDDGLTEEPGDEKKQEEGEAEAVLTKALFHAAGYRRWERKRSGGPRRAPAPLPCTAWGS